MKSIGLRIAEKWGKELKGRVGKAEFIPSDGSDGKIPLVVLFDSADVLSLRKIIDECVGVTIGNIESGHGFIPHITIGYYEENESIPDLELESIDLTFDKMWLFWGDEKIAFTFTNPSSEETIKFTDNKQLVTIGWVDKVKEIDRDGVKGREKEVRMMKIDLI
jgi:hypothetical protein